MPFAEGQDQRDPAAGKHSGGGLRVARISGGGAGPARMGAPVQRPLVGDSRRFVCRLPAGIGRRSKHACRERVGAAQRDWCVVDDWAGTPVLSPSSSSIRQSLFLALRGREWNLAMKASSKGDGAFWRGPELPSVSASNGSVPPQTAL